MVVVGTGGMTVAGDLTEIDAKGQNAILTTVVHIVGVGITVSIIVESVWVKSETVVVAVALELDHQEGRSKSIRRLIGYLF